jgi:hypothetical protein
MNRKLLLAAIVLLVLLGLKYAVGQDNLSGVGWDAIDSGPDDYVFGVMMAAPIFGVILGIARIISQRHAPPILEPLRLK